MKKLEDEFCPVYLELPPDKIVELKFLLESYEGIGELRTLDNDVAIVVILGLKDTLPHIKKLIEGEKNNLLCKQISQPSCITNDWLIKTTVS